MFDDPGVATAIAHHEAASAATIAQDLPAFIRRMAPELVVNSPGNRVLKLSAVIKAFELGLIDYAACSTDIEYAALRPNGEILLMGAETVTPRGLTANVGKIATYRFSEVWRPDGDDWLLAIRQATIASLT